MGLLLNVDYGDVLVRAGALRALRASGVKSVGFEEGVDAYYVHYRSPIFGGRASRPVRERFLTTYVKSHYFNMCCTSFCPIARAIPR